MRCSCGNTQCFLCSANVHDYTHFDQRDYRGVKRGCTLYGDTKGLLKKEVQDAQDRTVKEILERRGDVKEEDVLVDKEVEVPNTDGPGFPPAMMMGGMGGMPMPIPMGGNPFLIPGHPVMFGMDGLQQQFMNMGNPFFQPQQQHQHGHILPGQQPNNPFLHNPMAVFGHNNNPFDPPAVWMGNNPYPQQQQQPPQPLQQPFWNENWPLPMGRANQRPAPIIPPPHGRHQHQQQAHPNQNNNNAAAARTRQETANHPAPRSARNAPPTPQNRNNNRNGPAAPPNTPRNNNNNTPTPTPGTPQQQPRIDLAAERRAPRTPTWLQGGQNPFGHGGMGLPNPFGGQQFGGNNNGRDVNGPRTAPLPNTGRRLGDQGEFGDQM
jgi:hypothetical protein